MKRIGLTGSIAMGKSEVARIFRKAGIPVHDADAVVRDIYASDAALKKIAAGFPEATRTGKIDRHALSRTITAEPHKLKLLEEIIHPLVRQEEERFLAMAQRANVPMVILDIPLLFETGRKNDFDAVIVVSSPAEIQHERAMQRTGMTEEKLKVILARQMPDDEKRRFATHVIENNGTLAELEAKVHSLINRLAGKAADDARNRS